MRPVLIFELLYFFDLVMDREVSDLLFNKLVSVIIDDVMELLVGVHDVKGLPNVFGP